MFKRVPLPLSGLMLGCFAMGNLVQSYGEGFRMAFGVLGTVCLILLLGSFLTNFDKLKEDLKNPVLAGIFGTFSMSLMLAATYIKPFIPAAAPILWWFAVAMHIVLIAYYTIRFIAKKKFFTTAFIVYCGIAVASVTSPAMGTQSLGRIFFYFALASFFILVFFVVAAHRKGYPEPLQHLFYIYAAPVSLCLAGYIQSFDEKSRTMILALLALSSAIYLIVLYVSLSMHNRPFYPSDAAYTFPFVISAIACKQSAAVLTAMGMISPLFASAVGIETAIALYFVIRTYWRFMKFIFAAPQAQPVKEPETKTVS